MRAKVNENCIACGLCVNLCSAVFTMLPEGAAGARDEIGPEYYDQVREAAESCPVDAIEIEE